MADTYDEEDVVLETQELSDDDDEDFDYGMVGEEEEEDISDDDEDLNKALASIKKEKVEKVAPVPRAVTQPNTRRV